MKKLFYILASAIVALGAVACQNDINEGITPNAKSDVVSFTVAFDEATRIAMTTEDKTAKFDFETDDVLYVWPHDGQSSPVDPNKYEPYVFTTEDGKNFSCKSADLVEALERTGNKAVVSNTRYLCPDSYKGIEGFYFRNGKSEEDVVDITTGNVTLGMYGTAFHLTVPENTTATLKYKGSYIFCWNDDTFSTYIELSAGEHWVAAYPAEGNILSYSINGVVVKSIEKDFEAGKIYNLGTLSYEFTTINTKEQLIAFAEHVNAGNNYYGKTVKLGQSIDLEGVTLAPIGNSKANAFRGNFDGQNNTISSFTVKNAEVAGLFGMLAGGSIKNLNVDKATINGNSYAGGIVAWVQATSYQGWQGAADAVVDNCNVTNTSITSTVINDDNAAKVGGIAGYVVYGTISNSTVANTDIKAYRDMGGIAGMANFASSNGKGAVISGNTVGEKVTITVDNSNNYNKYTTADQYNVASIVGRITTGAIVENNTGEATIVLPKTAVEKLNEQIAAGESNITLTEDVVFEAGEVLNIPAGKEVTIDLGGNAITYANDTVGESQLVNNGTLTIENGTIEYTYNGDGDAAYSKGNYTIQNRGTLTLGNGAIVKYISDATKHAGYAIDNYAGATLNITDDAQVINENNYAIRVIAGTNAANNVNISGGHVQGTRALWIQLPGSTTTDAPEVNVNINGGIIEATGEAGDYKLAIYSYSYGNSMENVKINVEGGELKGDIALTGGKNKTKTETVTVSGGTINKIFSYANVDVAKQTISITGGTFGFDPTVSYDDAAAYENYIAKGYKAVKNSTVWTVKTWNPVASVNGEEFEDLTKAIEFANGSKAAIKLLVEGQTIKNACVISKESKAFKVDDGFLALKNYNNANGHYDVVAVTKATDCAIPGTHNNWDTAANGVYIINGTSLRVAPNVAMKANNEFKFYLLNWARAKGATTTDAITVNSKLTAGGNNIKVGTEGTYDLYLNGNVAFYVANQDTNNKNILNTLGASTGDLFLNFNGQDWAAANATIAAYYYGGPSEAKFVKMTDTNSDGIYECTAPADDYTHIIFVRLSENTLDWNKKWNQTPGDSKVALKGAGSLGILTAYEQVEIVY